MVFFMQVKLNDLAGALLFGAGFQIIQFFGLTDIGAIANHFTVAKNFFIAKGQI
jgi:hypothetical protein